MLKEWKHITASSLGFPRIPANALFFPSGKILPWIKENGTNYADWYMIVRSPGLIKQYVDRGGDPAKAIIHCFAEDAGVADALWSPNKFLDFVAFLKSLGITHVVPPDFSINPDRLPIIQLYQKYKQAMVTFDFALAGFKIWPFFIISAPAFLHINNDMYNVQGKEIPTAIVSGQHIRSNSLKINLRLFQLQARTLHKYANVRHVYVYARTKRAREVWSDISPIPSTWIPNAMWMRDKAIKLIQQRKAHAKST